MEGKFEEIGGIKHFITDDKKYRVVQTLEIVYHAQIYGNIKKKKQFAIKK